MCVLEEEDRMDGKGKRKPEPRFLSQYYGVYFMQGINSDSNILVPIVKGKTLRKHVSSSNLYYKLC